MGVDSVVDCACSLCDIQGSTILVVRLEVAGVFGVMLGLGAVWFCMLLRLKYHEGAVKVIGDVFGVVSMRTSNS